MKRYAIGVDVGGTKTAYGLFDSERKLLCKWRRPSDATLEPEQFFEQIAHFIGEIIQNEGLEVDALLGVGIGMPSYILYEEGRIIKTVSLPKIRNFPARDFLQQKLGENIRVEISNDAQTGALAESRHGAGRGFKHMLYCPVSTGISSAIVIDGQLFRGSYGWAGETGHMIITPDEGELCGCGHRGCLMSYCSGGMIVKHIRRWIASGESSAMVEMAGSAEQISAEHILQAYDVGDALARRAVDQMAKYMAIWLYNVYQTLNINCFVFGGGLLNFGDRLFGKVREQFEAYNGNDAPVYFKSAELTDDFGIIGAAELLY